MNTGYLYKHIRKDNGNIFYIGIGGFDKREKINSYNRAYSRKGRNPIWNNISNKTDYIVEILYENLTKVEAIELEKKYINKYGRIDINSGTLANMTDGGDGQLNMSIENRNKLSQIAKTKIGSLNPFYGRKHTETSKYKIGKYLRTEKNSISIKKAYQDGKLNKSGVNNHMYKKLYQFDLNGNLINTYNYITEVEMFGFTRRNVHNCLNGMYRQYKGYYWSYDVNKNVYS